MSTATPPAPQPGPLAWARAFTGFYPAEAQELSALDPVARFLYAARSVILVISAQAALIAGLLAVTARRVDVPAFVLVLLGYVVLHALSNLSNDYVGHRRGHDTADSPRRRYTLHPIASGAVSTRLLATGVALLLAAALAIAGYFVALRGLPALWLAVLGGLVLYGYDAAPTPLKQLGLGELASFVVWGPLMVGGGYYVITGRWSAAALVVSVPYGLGVASILVGKHIDQRAFDLSAHQRTLPVLLGSAPARRLDQVVVAGMYAATLAAVATGTVTPFALVVLLALPRGLRALAVLGRPAPAAAPAGYVGWPLWYHRVCLVHNRLFGWLLIAGLLVGAFVPHLRLP